MTDQLVQEIYIQLLELYTFDLEVELLSETLKNVRTLPYPPVNPTPWQDERWPRYPFWNTFSTTDTVTTPSGEPVKAYPFSEKYDAYYNEETNEWLESRCDDPNCEYCLDRPDRPL